MAWTIFTSKKGSAPAVSYAHEVLKDARLPQSKSNVRFVYDWELSEGGGGQNNPLNVGTVLGMATSGSQYGGGANDYGSLASSAQAVADELHSKLYGTIGASLRRSTYTGAKSALVRSPWAGGHYRGGAAFATAKTGTPPGSGGIWHSIAHGWDDITGWLTDAGSAVGGGLTSAQSAITSGIASGENSIGNSVGSAIFSPLTNWVDSWAKRVGIIVGGAILVLAGIIMLVHSTETGKALEDTAGKAGAEAALA